MTSWDCYSDSPDPRLNFLPALIAPLGDSNDPPLTWSECDQNAQNAFNAMHSMQIPSGYVKIAIENGHL